MSLSKENEEAIALIIQQTVNGKIKRIEDKLDGHILRTEEIASDIKPVLEAIVWIDSTRKFLLYIGGIVGVVASILALAKFK